LALGCWLVTRVARAAEETNLLRPPRPLLGPPFWETYGRWVLAAMLAVLAGVALVLWWRRRPKSIVVPSPAAVARQALRSLQGRPEDEALALDVSRLLRRYVIDALELPHAELTTAELDAVLQEKPRTRPELSAALLNFLRECDVKKFAPVKPPGPEGLVARALEFVNRIEAERQAPPTLTAR
jgi:hypothetical protein